MMMDGHVFALYEYEKHPKMESRLANYGSYAPHVFKLIRANHSRFLNNYTQVTVYRIVSYFASNYPHDMGNMEEKHDVCSCLTGQVLTRVQQAQLTCLGNRVWQTMEMRHVRRCLIIVSPLGRIHWRVQLFPQSSKCCCSKTAAASY